MPCRLVETIRYASMGLERLGTRSIGPRADYLRHDPPSTTDRERAGARDLAVRLEALGLAGFGLYRRGREDLFGFEAFNPAGFGLRIALKDGRRVEDALAET